MIKKQKGKLKKNLRELWYESFVLDNSLYYMVTLFFITIIVFNYFLCFLIIFSFTNLMTIFCINNNI